MSVRERQGVGGGGQVVVGVEVVESEQANRQREQRGDELPAEGHLGTG